MKNKPYQTGMTLIEIMIALLIGAFLLGGVLQIFIGSKQTYRVQEGLSRLQENGRFALDFLSNNIRMAGFLGCNSQAPLTNTLSTPTSFLYNFGRAIEGFESTSSSAWTPAIDAAITSPLGGSDVITIRKADDQSFTVTTHAASTDALTLDATATTANLRTAGFLTSAGANGCATAVVSDCSANAVFQVSAIAGSVLSHNAGSGCTPDNSTNDLGKTYVSGQVYPINTISYYIRTGAGGQPSLYRRIGSSGAEELVEGIEQMQILYGEDTDPTPDGAPNYYVPANNVVDMTKVVSIRISLLAATLDDNLTTQRLEYTYNGTTTTPTDNKIRRVFNTTIAVRN
jgi:type IV pilus assembly protein PilW